MAKEKLETLVSEDEQPFSVYQNWSWTRLSALYKFIDYRGATPHKTESGIPLVTAKNVKKGYIDYSIAEFISEEEYLKRQSRGVSQQGDILFTTEAPMGNVAIADLKKYSAGQRVITFQKHSHLKEICNRFYYYYMLSVFFQKTLDQQKTGSTVEGIKAEKLKLFPVPVPPLLEQQRIADRIENLFAKLDEAKEKAQAVVDGYEDRKAAILHQAFSGELTAEWRKRTNVDRKSWQQVLVKDVCCDIKVGIVIKPSQYYTDREKGTPAFRSANVREFHIDDFDWVYLNDEGMRENRRSIVHVGDVLVVRSGNPGTACVVEDKYDGYNAIDILIAVPDRSRITSEFLCAFTNSPLGRKLVAENKRGMALAHFNVSGYSTLSLELPSIPEQTKIIQTLYTMLGRQEKVKNAAEDVISQIDTMKKAILARAFRGELGTNDPSEPPADIS